MRLTHRLLVLIAVALLPISAFLVYSALEREARQTAQTYAETQRLLSLIEDELSGTLSGIRLTLTTISQTRAVMEGDRTACQSLMDRLRTRYPAHLGVYVTDNRGVVICATDRAALGNSGADRSHVQAALTGQDFYIGSRIVARSTGRTALPMAIPYRAQGTGAVAGAVIALLDADWLKNYLAGKPLPSTAVLTVADRNGTIIAQAPDQPEIVGRSLPESLIPMFQRENTGVEQVTWIDGVNRLVAYSPVARGVDGLFLSVGIDEAAALDDIHRGRNRALMLVTAIALFTIGAALWMGRRYVEEPAAGLAAAAARWRGGDLTARAAVTATAFEFSLLAADFNVMADALDARERALQASETRHRAVFETAVDAMVVIDEHGIVQASNPATAAAFGYSGSRMLGRNVAMLMGEDHRSRHDGYLDNYLRTGVRRIIGIGREVEGRRADGTLFPLELAIAEWRDPDGTRYFTGIMRDISARRAAERQAGEERGRLRRIIENAPFPAIVHAEDGEVLHISRAWLEITGYSREQLSTIDRWTERAYGDAADETRIAVKAGIDRLYRLERPLDEGEYVIRTAEGRKRVWAFRSAPVGVDASGRRLVVSMAADITERRDGEERLKLLMREVDHRAKNALTVVQSIIQLSRSEDPTRFVEAVEGRIQAMARAHSLLAAARWSGVDLKRLLSDEFEAYGGLGRIAVTGPSVSLRPEAAQAVSLALHELTTNAAKHGALSVGEGRVYVRWDLPAPEMELYLEWSETGGPTISGPPDHEGFGSVLMRQVVEGQLGGTLRLEWMANGLFCLLGLPGDVWQAGGVEDIAAGAAVGLSLPEPSLMQVGRRVLVVEDEALTALALQSLLESAGYIVLGPVGRVEDALNLLRSGPPDAAILDVNLFGATVDPVAAALDDMGVPFLFCTGYHKGAAVGEKHPRAPVLGKPVKPATLLTVVNDLLSA